MFFALEKIYFSSVLIQLSVALVSLMACGTLITTLQSVQLIGSSYEFPLDNQTYYSLAFYADIVYFVVFLFDYIMILCTNSRAISRYLVSFDSLVVVFAVISVATFMNKNVTISVGFLRFPTILRVTRVFRLFDVNPVVIEAWELGLSLVSFFLVNSGIVFAIQYNDSESFYYSYGDISFFDCVYFTVSSITTVGYGDIVANTYGAKAWTIIMIISGFSYLLYDVISSIVNVVIKLRRQYRNYVEINSNIAYILICGLVDYEILSHFLSELYAGKPNSVGFKELYVVILSPHIASRRIQSLISSSKFHDKILYLQGSAKNSDDLRRVSIESFTAIYIIRDIVTQSLRVEEDSIFLSAISVSKFLETDIALKKIESSSTRRDCVTIFDDRSYSRPMVMVKMTNTARGQSALVAGNVDIVISMQEFMYCLVGMGAVVPGFIAVFASLCRVTNLLGANNQCHFDIPHEYFEGTQYSLREVLFEREKWHLDVIQMTFACAIRHLYLCSEGKVILVAGIRQKHSIRNFSRGRPQQSKNVNLFVGPKDNIKLADCYSLFVISKSLEDVEYCIKKTAAVIPSPHGLNFNVVESAIDPFSSHKKGDLCKELDNRTQRFSQEMCNLSTTEKIDVAETKDLLHPNSSIESTDRLDVNDTARQDELIDNIFDSPRFAEVSSSNTLKSAFVSGLCSFGISGYFGQNTSADTNSFYKSIFKDHIVIVIESQKSRELNSLMLQIIYCLRSIRKLHSAAVLVFSERALELSDLSFEIQSVNADILSNVFFYMGHPRNPNHLKNCFVFCARSVILIGSEELPEPLPDEEEEDEGYRAMIQIDRCKTVTSLTLHTIYNDWSLRHNCPCKTFTVVELSHEINIKFLSQEPEWPLLISGGVFCHSVIDALMVSSIFSPNLILFWNVILDIEGIESMESRFKSSRAFYQVPVSNQKSCFDIIAVPTTLVNCTFQEVFLELLASKHLASSLDSNECKEEATGDVSEIAIGLYRPLDDGGFFVHIVPTSCTIVRREDRIFVFKPFIT